MAEVLGPDGARAPDRRARPPDGAKALVDLFRAEIEAKAGADLDRPDRPPSTTRRPSPGWRAGASCRDLEIGDERGDDAADELGDEERGPGGRRARRRQDDDDGDGEGDSRRQRLDGATDEASPIRDGRGRRRARWRRRRTIETPTTPTRPPDLGDGASRPDRRTPTGDGRADAYKVFTTAYDEVVDADDLCDPEELTRLRAYLDQQLAGLSSVVSRLANRLQRRCWPSRTAPGASTWRRACSTPRA